MWFWLSLAALLFWSGSDIFSKIGSKPDDKHSHWKMAIAVGLIMGLHALYEMTVGGVKITLSDIVSYLPVSLLYIGSMLLGYIGLRYIELGVSSPICNSSGAITAILCFLFLQEMPSMIGWGAVALIAFGLVFLGVTEAREDEEAKQLRQQKANVKYAKSMLGFLLPIAYCILDALGTFADTAVLREEDTGTFLDKLFPTPLPEDVANVAYELTFLAVGICAAIYVFIIRREKVKIKKEAPKLLGGVCETIGQFAYIYAIGTTEAAGFAAAIISSYCALSALWGRIFLKEKLSYKHYIALAAIFMGIVILGVLDP